MNINFTIGAKDDRIHIWSDISIGSDGLDGGFTNKMTCLQTPQFKSGRKAEIFRAGRLSTIRDNENFSVRAKRQPCRPRAKRRGWFTEYESV